MDPVSLEEFADRISEIMPAIMREFIKSQEKGFYNMKVTLPQFVVIEILSRQGESRMTDLANIINVTTAAMTGIVGRLVRDGYVMRSSDSRDRRIIKVGLTKKGEGLASTVKEKRRQVIIKMFGMISQEEREKYLEILTHIYEHVKEIEE